MLISLIYYYGGADLFKMPGEKAKLPINLSMNDAKEKDEAAQDGETTPDLRLE